MRLLFLALLLGSLASAHQKAGNTLSGTVRDRATGEPIVAANVRLLGSSRGTITNADGYFTITIDPGEHRILCTMLGYAPDTLIVQGTTDTQREVRLEPSAILFPEIVVSSEDPAVEIIRRAIANKQRWIDRLHSYEMQAFTRQTIFRDTAVAGIAESYTHGYWRAGDTLREVVTQKRQTANIPSDVNVASVGRILNFAEDNIRLFGYTFVGPTSVDALDYYDYKLLRTRTSGPLEIYDIRMTPKRRTVPLFDGSITIINGTYALAGVDVQPNEAFRIPFVRAASLRYRQQFALYEATFWMPTDIRIEGRFVISLAGFSIPLIAFGQTSVISDYSINTPIPDSIIARPRLSVDSTAATVDSAYWASHVMLPLTGDEQKAYTTLDSTQTLDVQFRPGGAAMTIGAGLGGTAGAILSCADLSFNRAEGFHAGASIPFEHLAPVLSASAAAGYAFTPRVTTYDFSATIFTSAQRILGFGGEGYRRFDHHPDHDYFEALTNSLNALFFKNDYRDYYRAEGGRVLVRYRPTTSLLADLSFVMEDESALDRTTNYSFFYRSLSYRPNPIPVTGILHSLRLDMRIGPEPVPLDLVLQNSFLLSMEHSDPSFTGGDFSFTRCDGVLALTIPTFADRFLLRPGFRLRVSAGASAGTLPPQRWFDLESASSGEAPLGVMHTIGVKQYSGTGYAAVNIEHNFRSLPFLALGIPFLYENEIELILLGGAARTWSHGSAGPSNTTDGWCYEAGFGISRILGLLRVDFTYALNASRLFRVTTCVAGIY